MPDHVLRGVLISDFNIANLAGLLANESEEPVAEATAAPFGQTIPVLMDGDHEIWGGDPSFAVIWTRPEGVIESFQRLTGHQPETSTRFSAKSSPTALCCSGSPHAFG